MAYTATNNLNDLVETQPLDTEPVSNLGPAMRETRRTFKAVIEKEHNADGTHASVNGDVLVAGSVPLTALAGGGSPGANTITTAMLQDQAVTVAKIADATITAGKVALKTLTPAQMLGTTSGNIWVVGAAGAVVEVAMSGGATINHLGVVTLAAQPGQAIAIFADVETTGTDGGTFTSGAWQTRKLNSAIVNSSALWNLSANVLLCSTPGTYYIRANAVAYKTDLHQLRLWDNINNAILADGTPVSSTAASTDQTSSDLECVVVIMPGGSQSMILQHRCTTTEASDGFGKNSGFGDNNIFAKITIIKIA